MKDCIECKVRPARYWGSNLCEECYLEILRYKLDEDKPVKAAAAK